GAVAQAHHGRALGRFSEIREQVFMVSVRFLADTPRLRMIYLFQCPGCGVEPTPGVATGREPGPPVADVLQSARRQQAALELLAIGSAAGFADDPFCTRQNSNRGAPQPYFVARETIMFGEAPQNPAMVLVVAAVLVAAGAVENAFARRKVPRQSDRSL